MNPLSEKEEVAVYRAKIIDEICYALGIGREGVWRRLLGPLFGLPARRFGRIAARADRETAISGLSGGARRVLPDFSIKVSSQGTKFVPGEGPLLIASNHPGALDSLVILSSIPRKDVKVLISDVPFSRAFIVARRYFIYVPPQPGGRRKALQEAIDHLRKGGALLIFAHGDVEPDPELIPGGREAIQEWSRSIEIMLSQVPESWLQLAIVSGVLARKFVRSPIVKIRRSPARRQKLAEVLQLSWQMAFPRSVNTHAHLSFANPVKGTDLPKEGIMPAVIKLARLLLEDHLASWSSPSPPV